MLRKARIRSVALGLAIAGAALAPMPPGAPSALMRGLMRRP